MKNFPLKNVKRYLWAFPLAVVSLVGFALSGLSHPAAVGGANGGEAALAAAVTLSQTTRGVAFYTAAINSDGSIASCFNCVPGNTFRLGVGQYQVDFGQNVQATNGWSRWLQPDTLGTLSVTTFCDTADRGADVNAVWVNCQNAAGTATDTSFFLFVAR
jgi:hypothetical protein